MVKRISAFLAMAVVVATLAGCSTAQPSQPQSQTQSASTAQPATSQPAASSAPAAPAKDDYLNKDSQFPITKEVITVNGFGQRNPQHTEFAKMEVLKKYEEMTNIKINWTDVPQASYNEKKNIMMASGDYPDFFWRGYLTAFDEVSYGDQGVLVPLNDLIETYGANLKERFNEDPAVRKGITQPDGKIYGLPQANNSDASMTMYSWINKEFLDNLKLEMPKTTDDLFTVLKAIADNDANKNGVKDEIALTSSNKGQDIFRQLCSYWGFGTMGMKMKNELVDLGPDGNVRFMPTDPKYKELVQYVKNMWDAGILDKEMLTQGAPEVTAKGDKNLIGAYLNNNNAQVLGTVNMSKYVAIPTLTGPYGDKMWTDVQPVVQNTGAFAITSKCKYPEAMLRWADYWYGEEGSVFLRMGIKGVTYDVKADGTLYYLDEIIKNPKGLSTGQAMGQYSPGIGGGLAHFIFDKYEQVRLEPAVYEAYDNVKKDLIPEAVTLTFTLKEQETLKGIVSDIDTYVKEARIKFITGADSMDNWDKYVKQIENMRLKEMLDIYNAAYQRYKAS